MTPPPAQTTSESSESNVFRFVLTSQPIRQRALLRDVQVAEILQGRQVNVLQELIGTTLYGKPTLSDSNHDRTLPKAMSLLQLSCQYALHCKDTLDEHQVNLEKRRDVLQQRIHRRRSYQQKFKERRCIVARELTALDCSLDATKMMLQHLDPDLYDKLQEETQTA